MQAAAFVRKNLWDTNRRRLRRSYCRGPSDIDGFDSDYAFLVAGLLELYAAGGDSTWLAWAFELQDRMDELFWDSMAGRLSFAESTGSLSRVSSM